MITSIKSTLLWLPTALSAVAAYYWYKASTAVITDQDEDIHQPGVEMVYTDPQGRQIKINASAMEQSRLNKIAALWTAAAIFLQAIANIIP